MTSLANGANTDEMPSASTGFVRPIFTIHPKLEVNEGIFARLDHAIRAELVRLGNEASTEESIALTGFFHWALENLDPDAYAYIQNRFIAPYVGRDTPSSSGSPTSKFLNFTYYVKSKMPQIHRLGLHKCPPKRILDIGCGPGHFQLLAKYFGHDAIGIDVPLEQDDLFNVLCEYFSVRKLDHRIQPMQCLPDLGMFDFATIFLAQFDFDKDKRPWDVNFWHYFVEHISTDLLKADGVLYLTLTSRKRPPEVWDYLESVAEWTHNSRAVLIRSTRPMA